MARGSVLVAVVVLLGTIVAPIAEATEPTALDATPVAADRVGTITYQLSLTPGTPGEIEVTATVSIPEDVRQLRVDLDSRQTAIDARGFDRGEDGDGDPDADSWHWDGETARPSLTYAVAVNRSNQHVEGIDATDVGPWALFVLSDAFLDYQYWYVGTPQPRFERQVRLDGEGVAGDRLAYLGPHRRYDRTAGSETFVLVVPADADLHESPTEILDALERASGQLSIGPRRERVHAFAVPFQLRRGGLAIEGDFWVTDGMALDDPNNVWLHEYVHTRQHFRTTPETRWLVEASAEYYAALLTWRQGRIGDREFLDHLDDDRHAEAVLADSDSWASPMVPYVKGQRVLAVLDAEIRAETDGEATLQDVLVRLNGEQAPITHADLAETVATVADRRFDDWLDRYVRGGSSPPVPDDPSAFGRADDRPTIAPEFVEFQVRGEWDARPEVVPSGIPVEVRYRGDEAVVLEAGANATVLDDGTVQFVGDPATVVVRSATDETVAAEVTVRTSDDVDDDGLSNAAERARETDPWNPDSDGDGLGDGDEVRVYGTDPLSTDTDGDGLDDREEIETHGTDPTVADSDGDGLDDREEIETHGTDPLDVDTDGDGLADGAEVQTYGTDPRSVDTDGDGYEDGREVRVGTDPTVPTPWWRFAVVSILDRLSAWLG